MLSEIGSIASVVGVLVSLLGLGFALLQLRKLRGETRAAREASEETRRLLSRDLVSTDLTRLNERIQGLIELHRSGDRRRALDRYPEIWDSLIRIRRRHPNLSEEHRRQIQNAVETITNMQRQSEELEGDALPKEIISDFNVELLKLQSMLLAALEDELQ